MTKDLKLFISYANKDAGFFDELLVHLKTLEDKKLATILHDKLLLAGDRVDETLSRYLQAADIILFLVSPDSLTSEFVNREIQAALYKEKNNEARIVPVLVRHCEWKSSPLVSFQFLPSGAKPIDTFTGDGRENIYKEIATSIETLIGTFRDDWAEILQNEKNNPTGTLDLSNYKLTSIPTALVDMYWLVSLNLSNNLIYDINLLGKLEKLEHLDLSHNKISTIYRVTHLSTLTTLNMSSNQVSSLDSISRLKNLTKLDMHLNNIEAIPDLKNLIKLNELDLSNNKISKIEGLQELAQLAVLNLSGNKLTGIEGLPQSPNLVDLKIMDNAIAKIDGLDALPNLKMLDLFKNQITRIENLHANVHLHTLGLSLNKIRVLKNISHLSELEILYVGHNSIEDITELQNMHRLRRVVLTNNRIIDLFPLKQFIENDTPVKAEYSFDSNENGFFVKDNPIQYPPPEVLAQGKNAILRNFSQQEAALLEALPAYQSTEIKLILLGNANVGKTFLATYIKTGRKKLPLNNASTHGMVNNFFRYKSPSLSTTVKMRILDFGGQEYYHDTHHLFFTNDTIYLLLWEKDSNRFGVKTENRFSVKTGKTEEETNAVFPIAYWLDAVNYFITRKEEEKKQSKKNVAPFSSTSIDNTIDPVVILVETKRNKKGYTMVDTSSLLPFRGLIHSQLAVSVYRDENAQMVSIGTQSLFDSLDNLVGSMFEKRWSGYYKVIVDFFDNIEDPVNGQVLQDKGAADLIINLQNCILLFNEITWSNTLKYKFDNENAQDLCRFLANRGYILFFDNDKICLFPEKLTGQIYRVLNKSYNKVGIISTIEAAQYPAAVISIMQDFKLLIQHPAGTGFIAPQLLPEDTTSQLNMFLEAFKPPVIRFSIGGYLHKNIIQELFNCFKENLVKEDTQNYIWKNGFIVKLDNELYKININSTDTCRLIEIQYLNTLKMATMNLICANMTTALAGRSFTKEVSLDGKLFVPIDLIQQNLQLSQFIYDGKLLRLADYKNFLDPEASKYSMKKVFISYSSKDTAFMRRFVTHLEPLKRNGAIDYWHDRMIEPGTKWDDSIQQELERSEIIIFLLSPDFIATNYIFEVEIPKALTQFTSMASKLFFVELKSCSWDRTILKEYQQTTDQQADNKKLITIGDPLKDDQWKLVIDSLEKTFLL